MRPALTRMIGLAAFSIAVSAGPQEAWAGLPEDWNTCLSTVLNRPDAAGRTDPGAQYCVGLAYLRGHNTRQDYGQAAAWFGKAAAQNHPGAMVALGYLHEEGKGMPPDKSKAFDFYRRSAAQGSDEGLYYLGRAYAEGIGVAKDTEQAKRYYREAAQRGHAKARRDLADIAAAENPSAAESLWNEGVRLYGAKDPAAAFRSFRKAAEMGHVKAQVQVGFQYEKGDGVDRNEEQAARWYATAAAAGDSRAQKNLGHMFEMGKGVREDWAEAAKWYAKSAEQGDAEGQDALGRAYQFGMGVPQSRAKAIELYRKAAAQGNGEAAYFARWLSDRTNNIGFRNQQEQQLVIGNQLRTAGELLGADPAGLTFRNSQERLAWLAGLRQRVDRSEAMARWESQRREYEDCRRTTGRGCSDPGPAPR
jgi:uncharacterized protein